ncbi:proline-rich protein 36-like [Entelurus aequoreus]|uniref:proline-rich protein 36-like n=1 Tax=Entelurus aequoreus TaxID=161455 RepID=UPI002B1DAD8B|nr:proline-rich protein 36-like [Entelurus aequoreus]
MQEHHRLEAGSQSKGKTGAKQQGLESRDRQQRDPEANRQRTETYQPRPKVLSNKTLRFQVKWYKDFPWLQYDAVQKGLTSVLANQQVDNFERAEVELIGLDSTIPQIDQHLVLSVGVRGKSFTGVFRAQQRHLASQSEGLTSHSHSFQKLGCGHGNEASTPDFNWKYSGTPSALLCIGCYVRIPQLFALICFTNCCFPRDALDWVNQLGVLLSQSGKFQAIHAATRHAENLSSTAIKPLCRTRWTVQSKAITGVLSPYASVLANLQEMLPTSLPDEVATRTSSPIPLRSPSPHTFLSTLSDPLHQRHPLTVRRTQSADQQQRHRRQDGPLSSSSCHASLPLPPGPSPGARSPGRRKLPAIPAGAANTKFPSVIRITRAHLEQLTAHRPSGLSSLSGSDTGAPQCLLLERRDDDVEVLPVQERTADVSSPLEHPGTPAEPPAETLVNGDGHPKTPSPAPSHVSSPSSPGLTKGHLSSFPKLEKSAEEEGVKDTLAPSVPASPLSSPAGPRKNPSRRQSRIPVLDPSILLDPPPPGSAKEKLLQKKASNPGPLPSPSASPSLSDRRAAVASLARDPLSSASDRSQEEDSLMGSRSDRQGDASLSSSSSPLSRRSRIPRPVHTLSAEQLAAQFLPRPPPGKPPCRNTVEGRIRRYRIRAGSTSDSDLLTCLAQLVHGARGSPVHHHRSAAQHGCSRMGVSSLTGSPHHVRSSSASPRSSSSLQRSVSSSPSRHEHRGGGGGYLGRSRSPPSFSGSPPLRRFYAHHQETCCSRQARAAPFHTSRGKVCSREGKCSSKLAR